MKLIAIVFTTILCWIISISAMEESEEQFALVQKQSGELRLQQREKQREEQRASDEKLRVAFEEQITKAGGIVLFIQSGSMSRTVDTTLIDQWVRGIEQGLICRKHLSQMLIQSNLLHPQIVSALLHSSNTSVACFGLESIYMAEPHERSERLLFTPFAVVDTKLCEQIEAMLANAEVARRMSFTPATLGQDSKTMIEEFFKQPEHSMPHLLKHLAATRDLEILRIIMFLATYHTSCSSGEFREFTYNLSCITGDERVPDGTTALMFAVGGGYLEIVRYLLCWGGANPFLANNYGDTALSVVELQLARAKVKAKSGIQARELAIYGEIHALLAEYAKKKATELADAVLVLIKPRKVIQPTGVAERRRGGLPGDVAISIVVDYLGPMNRQDNQRLRGYIQRYLDAHPDTPDRVEYSGRPLVKASFLARLQKSLPFYLAAAFSVFSHK